MAPSHCPVPVGAALLFDMLVKGVEAALVEAEAVGVVDPGGAGHDVEDGAVGVRGGGGRGRARAGEEVGVVRGGRGCGSGRARAAEEVEAPEVVVDRGSVVERDFLGFRGGRRVVLCDCLPCRSKHLDLFLEQRLRKRGKKVGILDAARRLTSRPLESIGDEEKEKNKLSLTVIFRGDGSNEGVVKSFQSKKKKPETMTRNIRVRVPPPPGVTLIPEFITEEEEEVKIESFETWRGKRKEFDWKKTSFFSSLDLL